MHKKQIGIIAGLIFVLITIPVALYLVSQNQDNRQSAAEGDEQTPNQVSCDALEGTASVTVDYPFCEGGNCDLTRASCEWEAVEGAASYNVTINQVEDGSIVKDNESINGSTVKVDFPITQNKTYKCTVVVVSSCQSLSVANSDQLLCEADALLDPTPTTPPTTPVPTSTPLPTAPPPTATPIAPTLAPTIGPTSTPLPTPPPTGGIESSMGIIGVVSAAIIGGILLFAL